MRLIIGACLTTTIIVATSAQALAQDPVKLSPKMYTLLLDNEHVRVLEFRCNAGEKEPLHFHPGLVAYVLTPGKYRMTSDGKTTEGEGKPGEVLWGDAGTHVFECVSGMRTLITELKGVKASTQKK